MRRALVLVVLLVGCKATHDDFPILPGGGGGGAGGGGGGGGGGPDAPAFEGIGLSGQVCQLSDLRRLDLCDTAGVGNLTVTLGSKQATTADNGTFEIEDPGGNGLTWHVTGTNIVSSLEAFTSDLEVHTMRTSVYAALVQQNGVIINPGEGTLVERVIQNTAPVVGATADTVPAPVPGIIFYDGTSASQWDKNRTGTRGMVWVPGLPVGNVTVTIHPLNNGTPVSATRSVEEQSITFGTTGL